jgi:branched-chain amino acid aminotransferase
LLTGDKCADGYVRPIVWRGAEQMGVSPLLTKIHLAIAAWDFRSEPRGAGRAACTRMRVGPARRSFLTPSAAVKCAK